MPLAAIAQTVREQDRALREISESGSLGVKVGLSSEYTQGDYGSDGKKERDFLTTATTTFAYKGYSLALSLPWETLRYPDDEGATSRLSGFNDVSAELSGEFASPFETIGFVWYAGASLPTAKKGLGDEEIVYSAGLDATKDWESAYFTAGVGTDVSRSGGGLSLTAEAGYDVSDDVSLALGYDWKSSGADSDDGNEVSAYLGYDLSESVYAQIHALAGFSNSSPDFGGGASVTYRLK